MRMQSESPVFASWGNHLHGSRSAADAETDSLPHSVIDLPVR